MKKILICLPSQYYNKYIESNAFQDLQKNYHVSFLLNKNKWVNKLTSKKKISTREIKNRYFYSLDDKDHAFFIKTLHLFLIVNKKLSKTFRYNFRRWYPNLRDYIKIEKTYERDRFGNFSNFFLYKTILKYFCKPFFRRLVVLILTNRIIFGLYKKIILSNLKLNTDIERVVNKIRPDLIIYTTHCYEPETFMIPKIASNIGAKTFFLVDNWDNISCKTVFFNKPDFLGIWGKQSKNHAIKIQNLNKKKIFYTGNPKFDNYFLLRKKKLKNIFTHKYVLFFGLVELFDDIKVLKLLNEEINNKPELYKDLKVVYRPHPSRPNIFSHVKKIDLFNKIILDPNMKNYVKTRNNKYLDNNNDYFEKLLSNSLFNIGGLTTVTIESLIFKKKQIFLCYDEKDSITDPKTLFNVNLHFEKIDKVSALIKSKSINSVIKEFRNMYSKKRYLKIDRNLDKEINFFYNIPKVIYSKKIFSIVKKLI